MSRAAFEARWLAFVSKTSNPTLWTADPSFKAVAVLAYNWALEDSGKSLLTPTEVYLTVGGVPPQ